MGLGPVVVNGHYDEVPGLDADPGRGRGGGRHVAPRAARRKALAGGGRLPARPHGAAGRADRPGWPTSSRSPSSGCPFVFTAELGPTELDQLADRLLAEVEALPEVV